MKSCFVYFGSFCTLEHQEKQKNQMIKLSIIYLQISIVALQKSS